MSDPYRTASEPSTQRPPRKRWYVLFGDAPGPWMCLSPVLIGVLIPAAGFVESGFSAWILRALVVLAIFAAMWCLAFVRRSATPPKGAFVIGGDDE